MKLKYFVAWLLPAILLVGCAAPTTFKDSSWKQLPKTVTVFYTEPMEDKPGDYIAGKYDSVIVDKIAAESHKLISGSAKRIDRESVVVRNVKLGENDFNAPDYENTDDVEVYIVLDSLTTGSVTYSNNMSANQMAANGMVDMPGFYKTAAFRLYAKYAIYDAKNKQILAYGYQRGETQRAESMRYALSNLIANIVSYTPLSHW